MPRDFRFGRRMKLPSTVEIIHELKMMIAADQARLALDTKMEKGEATPEEAAPEVEEVTASSRPQ